MLRRGLGRDALAAWLRRRAKSADRVVALEEALLSGRFAGYAVRRLSAFGLARSFAAFVHIVELTWLYEIFSAKAFVASIALQNATLVIDAFFWGALESLRTRVRDLGPSSEGAALVTRWMSIALGVGAIAIALPIGVAAFGKTAPGMFHVYALVCGARLAADVVLRTYYSGVFAFSRVHRSVWSTLIGPVILVATTFVLWDVAGGWSFVVALVASVIASRTLLFVYTDRAYRRLRVPRPRLRLFARGAARVVDRAAILAGIANLSTRIGGIVLLAAIVPSLTTIEGPDDEPMLEPFAFSLHLAAPFILIATQWAFVFYHDWKRVERDDAARLARLLDRKLVATALVVALIGSAAASALVLVFVPWEVAWPTLLALLVAAIGLSVWTSRQLRRFSHGEHTGQVATAIALSLVVAAVLAARSSGSDYWYYALAIGPWSALLLEQVLGRRETRRGTGELASVAAFVGAITRSKDDVVVWDATVSRRAGRIAAHVASVLGTRGGVVHGKRRVVWYERAPGSSRAEWLRAGGGQLDTLARIPIAAPRRSESARRLLAERGIVAEPEDERDAERLAAEHARLFPHGFVLHVGAPPPPAFEALAPAVRQAIWRDALRARVGARRRGAESSAWFVTCFEREGAAETVFVAPRPVTADDALAWRKALAAASFRLHAVPPTSPRHPNEDAGMKPGADEGIVDA